MLGGMLAGAAAAAPMVGAARAAAAAPKKAGPKVYPNEHFYTEGKLDAAKAKAAYYELMAYHRFPILPVLKTDEFWVLDFALGKFTEVGMGGIFYVNRKGDNYLLHDIWLLPGQMIPEHYHIKTATVPAKMESWLVRHGSAYFYAEGEPTPGVDQRISPSHRKCAKARNEVFKQAGGVVIQPVPEARHCMRAGPQGAIVTEVATFHDNDALRFSHPDCKL